jgi:hypothetical protein
MTMTDDLKSRLLNEDHNYHEAACHEAWAKIEALTADNARLTSVVARFGLMFAGSVSVKQEDGRIVAVIVPPKGAVSHAALTGKGQP